MYRVVTALLMIWYFVVAWFANMQGIQIPGGTAVLMFPFGILFSKLFREKNGIRQSVFVGVFFCLFLKQLCWGYVGYLTGYFGDRICKILEDRHPLLGSGAGYRYK